MTSFSDQPQRAFGNDSLNRSSSSPRTLFNNVMNGVIFILGALALLPLVLVLSYLLIKGFSSLSLDLFTELPPAPLDKGGGFGNAILGTAIMVGIGTVITVPIGVAAAVYLTEFSKGQTARWIRFATNVLSGVPSIIAGVVTYGILVAPFGGYSAIAGGVALAILMLPIIVRTTDEALQLVSQDLRQAAIGVGATNYQTVLQIVLPAALPSILTGITLSVARAAGETAPLLFTALFSFYWARSLTEPTASLAVLVYNFAISFDQNQQSVGWAASLILVLLVLISSIIARLATRSK
ncbi:MAG: phosphate ABC transporter permease PstA [Richelia sp. RM2_1_2]|nr:phosphate ABC transporter permease PstA [Richelia sp. SM2_1_7]NJM23142.1 phosphate ABC transporter permease PstA [Richelia sp. SM1_7_0]NJN07044.1 phosphate ABC transporter permease PstA [Richelia sp. RM1_1_1]NJO27546.1 phosphate ABC transporter permease PstA [Richelia sp. SL_2_1]NJO58496.1 phosphate ABC transporter permease PstA [Richelia sp. RM2_1_2]